MPTYQNQQSQIQQSVQQQDISMNPSTSDMGYQMGFQMGAQMGYQLGAGQFPMSNQQMQEQMLMFQANQAARQSVIQSTADHRQAVEERGVGLYYGDKSSYHDLSEEEKVQWLQEQSGEGSVVISPDELTKSSCIEWAMEHVQAWYQAMGQDDVFEQIDAETRNADLKGTELAKILVNYGWQAWYTNPDTSYTGPEDAQDAEHTYSNHIADKQGTYYDVPLAGKLVDTDANKNKFNVLESLPFFLSVSRGGMHVTAGVDGQINELARGEGPDNTVIYQDPYRDIVDVYTDVYGGGQEGEHKARKLWGSGLILLPPGSPPLSNDILPKNEVEFGIPSW